MDLHDVQWPRRTDKATNIDDVSADTRTLDSCEYVGFKADGKRGHLIFLFISFIFFSFLFLFINLNFGVFFFPSISMDKEGGGGWTYLEPYKMILHLLSLRVFTILVSDLEAVGEPDGVTCLYLTRLAGPTQHNGWRNCSRLVPVPSSWDNQSFIMFNFLMMF
ncbi:hypothetical protein NEUTE2DRAFT_53230 [Neurospora tetrasperma FGSC 2509]|nr:hypothetical protein NEUTE2DRAFT_53230 [Neurospora tetrasperma FGSC 2509]